MPRIIRPSKTMRGWRLAIALAIATVLACGLYLGGENVATLSDLAAHGATVQATIQSKQELKGKSTRYIVRYTYRVGLRAYSGEGQTSEERFWNMKTGDAWLVTYLPSDPETHKSGIVDQKRVDRAKAVAFWMTFGIAAFLAAGLAGLELAFRWQKRLLGQGVLAVAKVLSKEQHSTGRETYYSVKYEFNDSGKGKIERSARLSLISGRRLQEGQDAQVVYQQNWPYHSKLVTQLALAKLDAQ